MEGWKDGSGEEWRDGFASHRATEFMELNRLSSQIIKAAINVHKELARPPRLREPKWRPQYVLHVRFDG